MEVGIAVKLDTDLEKVEPFFSKIDVLLIMTIEPGHQGNEFLPDNLKKVAQVRALGFAGEIEVDGGIDDTNIKLVKEKEADVAVVGHYLVKSDNPQERFNSLNAI